MKKYLVVFTLAIAGTISFSIYGNDYDLVISNGRVIDTETNFDAVRNVGIKDGNRSLISNKHKGSGL